MLKGQTKGAGMITHDQRLAFLSGSDDTYLRKYLRDFAFELLKEKDKRQRFEVLMGELHHPARELLGEIFERLEMVFNGINSSLSYSFVNDSARDEYLRLRPRYRLAIRELLKRSMRVDHYGLLIADRSQVRGVPYVWMAKRADVKDITIDDEGLVESVEIKDSRGTVKYDKTSWYRIDENGKQTTGEHGLTYCPVYEINKTDSIIADQFGSLFWYLFFEVAKRYNDLSVSYPITWGYQSECNYKTEKIECREGLLFVKNKSTQVIEANGSHKRCPSCSQNVAGPGSYIEVPIPDKDEFNMAPPVGRIGVDGQSLQYNSSEVSALRKRIYTALTGLANDVMSSEAINEAQVNSLMNQSHNVLLKLKKTYEDAQKWSENTLCSMMFGESFGSIFEYYGDRFQTVDANSYYDIYINARDKGADTVTLDRLLNGYYDMTFANESGEAFRAKAIMAADPLPHYVDGMSYPDELVRKHHYLPIVVKEYEKEKGRIGLTDDFGQVVDDLLNMTNAYIRTLITN